MSANSSMSLYGGFPFIHDLPILEGFGASRMKADMKTDIRKVEGGLEVSAELPGFKKEDISLTFKNGYLNISATTKEEHDKKDSKGNYIRRERSYGSCSRSYYIGDNVLEDNIKASFNDGILLVKVPVAEEKEPEAVKIEIE